MSERDFSRKLQPGRGQVMQPGQSLVMQPGQSQVMQLAGGRSCSWPGAGHASGRPGKEGYKCRMKSVMVYL